MTDNALAVLQFDAQTRNRAQWEAFEFTIEAPGIIEVRNGSYGDDADEHTYRVNVEGGVPVACECPAFEYQSGACKHMLAVAIREPVLDAATIEVVTDGGQDQLVASDGDSEPEPESERKGETTTPYTVHREPPEQGGGRYAKCRGCGREILPVGRFKYLTHPDDCPHADTTANATKGEDADEDESER